MDTINIDSINISQLMNKCQTGDLILYSSNNWISYFIEYFTGSQFSHIAMIIKDPTYIDSNLKGIYVLESGYETVPDPEDHKLKYGVQLTPIKEVINQYNDGKMGKLYYRQLTCLRSNNFKNKIKKIHLDIHNKPYDLNILDWLKADLKLKLGNERKTKEFWCSALIAYVYHQLGFLNKDIKWTIVTPKEFSKKEDPNDLKFINCILHGEQLIRFA
jgi:hypothetical protein